MLGLISGELGGMEVVYLLAESLPLQMRLLVCWRDAEGADDGCGGFLSCLLISQSHALFCQGTVSKFSCFTPQLHCSISTLKQLG